jgi:nucleotide-binding universal stress UspA family protein
MKKILLPTDFSPNSVNAIHYALNLFKDEKCTFYLLNVYRVPYVTSQDVAYVNTETLIDLEEGLKETSEERLKELAGKLTAGGNSNHSFEMISDYNFLSDSVKRIVGEKDIDLIVMGTKGATGAQEIFMGSNTGDIIMKVDCNVLAVPENVVYNEPREITFPTDYKISYEPEDLSYLLSIAKKHKAAIRVLHVQDDPLTEEQLVNKNNLETLLEGVEHSFHTLTGINFETAVNSFTQSRGNIDMIAIIARHYSFFQRLFFRPKVEELSFHTRIPLLVLHKN